MLVDEVVTRIEERVPSLARRTQSAADYAAILNGNNLPQQRPAAFVLPLGQTGGVPDSAVGTFRQRTDKNIGVVFIINAVGSGTGSRSVPTIDALEEEIIQAIAGWKPDSADGDFRLVRGRLLRLYQGTITYQVDFSIFDQIRIT